MADEAVLFTDRETDSTSRDTKESISSASSQIANKVTTKTVDRASGNVSELMQCISLWETGDRLLDDNEGQFSAAYCTNEKAERQLQKFFHLRRIFAEYREWTLAPEMDSTPGPSGQEGHQGPATDKRGENVSRNECKIYKKLKSAWKCCFKWKRKKKGQLTVEQDVESEDSDVKNDSPCPEETSTTASTCRSEEDIMDSIKQDRTSALVKQMLEKYAAPEGVTEDCMEFNPVTDVNATPGPSQGLLETEHVADVVGLARSYPTSQDAILTKEESSQTNMDAPSQEDNQDFCEDFLTASTQTCRDSGRTDDKSAKGHSEYREWTLAPEMDSTPGPSGQEGHQGPATDKRGENVSRNECKLYKKLKSAWKCCFKWKRKKKGQLTVEQDVESEDSDVTNDSPCPEEMSTTASTCHSEEDIMDSIKQDRTSARVKQMLEKYAAPEGVTEDCMEFNPVTDVNATPGPSQGLLETEHVADVVGLARSYPTSQDAILTKEESPQTNMDAPSQEDNGDVCEVFLTAITQTCRDSGRTDDKSAKGRESNIFQNMKSAWMTCFRSNPKKNVDQAPQVDLDEADGAESNNSVSGSPCPVKTSPPASVCSNDDIRDVMKTDLSSVNMEQVNVPEGIMEETMEFNPVTDLDATPGPSQGYLETEHVADVVGLARSYPTSQEAILTNEESPQTNMDAPSQEDNRDVCEVFLTASTQTCRDSGRTDDKSARRQKCNIYQNVKSAWKTCFSSNPKKNVNQAPEEDLDEADGAESTNSVPGSPCPEVTGPTASVCSSEDIKVATKADLISVSPELVNNVLYITQETKEVTSFLTPTGSTSQPEEHYEVNSAEKADLISVPLKLEDVEYENISQEPKGDVGSIYGAAAVAQLPGMRISFYNIIKGFFDSLTEEERREMSLGVYNIDVKKKLAEMCIEVLRLVIETIIETISITIKQLAPPNGNWTTESLTAFQECGTKIADKKLLSELFRERFDITEEKLQLSLNGSFGKAFCDVVGEDMTPTFTEAIVRKITDEVNSVLSDTIKASLDGNSSRGHATRCCQFSNCRACREMSTGVIRTLKSVIIGLGTPRKKSIQTVTTQGQLDLESKGDRSTAVHSIEVHEKRTRWWSLNKCRKTKIQPHSGKEMDESVRLSAGELSCGQTHSASPPATSNISSVHSIRQNTPTASVEDKSIVPVYSEGPSLSQTQSKVRSSSFHQCGDSGDGIRHSDARTGEVFMSASDADKSCCLCCCKGKKKEDKMASAQDRAVRTRRPALLKRILCCCCMTCCSDDDDI